MLQRMPPTFRAINEHGTTKLTLKESSTALFYWKTSTCLLIVDYYSRYIEISKLNISHKINLCIRHGYFKKLHPTLDSHMHPVNTSNLQLNMVSPTQQAAHAIFEVTGKHKEP